MIRVPVIITCKKPGFRRCGIAHPAGPVEYPDSRFTPEELERLKKEPKLIVQVTDGKATKPSQKDSERSTLEDLQKNLLEGNLDPAQLETMDYPVLKKLAKDMNLDFKANIKKTDLVELIASQPVFVEETVNPNPDNTELPNSSEEDNQDEQTGADE